MTDLHPDKLAELVARALCRVTGADPDGLGVDRKPRWRGWCQFAVAAIEASGIEALQAERGEYRAERDALLQKPIDLAKMDSIDDDATDRMIAYYWHEQAQDARARLDRVTEALRDLADASRSACDARQHPALTEALSQADDALNGERM